MRDPYEVLGVSPTDSDDEIKKAYRELVRKYHPDNYQGDPLQDMAEERMKEINDAYDQVQQIRSGKAPNGGGYGYAGYQQSGYQQQTSANPLYNRVRSFIQAGALDEAQRLLQTASNRDAEWHYLYGAIAYRKGWMDEAKQHFQIAVNSDPNNMEYRQALQQMQFGGVRFHGFNGAQAGGGLGFCLTLMCARWFCYCC